MACRETVTYAAVPSPRVALLCFSPKRPASPPPPYYGALLMPVALEQIGEFEECAVEQ
jgi:hypothetical protein